MKSRRGASTFPKPLPARVDFLAERPSRRRSAKPAAVSMPERAPQRLQLVRHQVVGRAKILLRRVVAQAGDAAGVHVSVKIRLQPEAAHLALLFEERPPIRMEALRDALGE